ncbi:TorF family putative porin [Phenylobacterium sp.]|uniref:TorF family putative porin n=1 Tax=Phenylobacterium sp. TaxID=1871053 RepID=UPI0030F4AF92
MKNRMIPAMIPCALMLASVAGAAQAGSWGRIYPQVSVVSDYRYDGVSSSDGHPVLQGDLYWWRPDNAYAGLFVTQVDFNDPGKTSYEVDVYAGKYVPMGKTRVKLEAMYTAFPDNRTWGPTYDFLTLKVGATRRFDKLTLGTDASWTPMASYGAGEAVRVAGEATYRLTPELTVGGKLTRRWVHKGYDRTAWNLGATTTYRNLTFDLRYYDTDLSLKECRYQDWCSHAVVAKVTARLRPLHRRGD